MYNYRLLDLITQQLRIVFYSLSMSFIRVKVHSTKKSYIYFTTTSSPYMIGRRTLLVPKFVETCFQDTLYCTSMVDVGGIYSEENQKDYSSSPFHHPTVAGLAVVLRVCHSFAHHSQCLVWRRRSFFSSTATLSLNVTFFVVTDPPTISSKQQQPTRLCLAGFKARVSM